MFLNNMISEEELQKKIKPIIEEVGNIALTKRNQIVSLKANVKHEETRATSLVTEVDTLLDKTLRDKLGMLYPDFGFITEESEDNNIKEYNWIIDPIDGTSNYYHGLPLWAVSVALYKSNSPVSGLLFFPALKQGLYGLTGGRKFTFKDELFSITPREKYKKLITYDGTKRDSTPNEVRNIAQTLQLNFRSFGTAVYGGYSILSQMSDVGVFLDLAIWDVAGFMALADSSHLYYKNLDSDDTTLNRDYSHNFVIGWDKDLVEEFYQKLHNLKFD